MSASEALKVIEDIRAHVDALRGKGACVTTLDLSDDSIARYASAQDGRPQIVLASEAFAELGGPNLGSRAAVLATAQIGAVTDRRVTLAGPAAFAEGGAYAWGIVLIVGSQDDPDEAYLQARHQNLTNAVEGCMLKSPLDKPWCRIGAAAAERGIRPVDIAASYLSRTKGALGDEVSAEVIMVIAAPQELGEFAALLQFEETRYTDVLGEDMSSRGIDLNCVPGSHCGSCSDRKACAEVRKIQKAREAVAAAKEEERVLNA